ncbi:MAG TPA: tetratricopeptide repeat protein [Burkholderiaceae bacterium]|jgi:tetratricopeptide (TPR) repeat protein|nr:tetratricopeptide repeat protein [Burkholderiaceae bacterium]
MKTSPLPFLHRPSFASGMRLALNKTFIVTGLLTALVAAPVFADELGDVTKSVKSGQYAEALGKADAFLAKHPHDAQMRFLKGVILTEQGKSSDAIAVFTKLTDDFPELPEPYNNLAVLYASAGQYDKARMALDNAIRTNPAYATAYENLGDVHAKLASQAYDKALQLDSGNTAAKSKLTLLRTLAGNNGSVKVQAAVATTTAPAMTATTSPPAATATVTSASAASTTKPVVVAAATPVATPPVVKTAAAKPEAKPEPKPEPKPDSKPAKPANDDNEEILAAVHGWAKAWSEQDVKTYLNYYGNDFETPKGESRKDWAEERHQRIEGKNRIEVKVESPQVTVNGNSATVRFRQLYVSDRLKADSRKVLVLSKQSGKWQIKQERAGS